jgi:hypothetical protein
VWANEVHQLGVKATGRAHRVAFRGTETEGLQAGSTHDTGILARCRCCPRQGPELRAVSRAGSAAATGKDESNALARAGVSGSLLFCFTVD